MASEMIDIGSYQGVNDVHFGSTQDAVRCSFGPPERMRVNSAGEAVFYFGNFALRFDSATEEFRECSIFPGCRARVNGVDVEWSNGFLRWLVSQDDDLKEVCGFIVSVKLGLAVTGFHDGDESQRAIHAFRRGDWDDFSEDMISFKL